MASLIKRALNANLCPKASVDNISEFRPIKALFQKGQVNGWSPLALSSTFLVARGIRGREGIQVLCDYCESQYWSTAWQDADFVQQFVDYFEERWEASVKATGKVSALSHQEGRHSGLSGMHFVNTLKRDDHRLLLLADVAVRFQPFFATSIVSNFNAETLMNAYAALVAHPFALATRTYEVHIKGVRIVGKKPKIHNLDSVKAHAPTVRNNSYNSMDFLRCYYNIMVDIFLAPSVFFTPPLWTKMIRCMRSGDFEYFKLSMDDANWILKETEYLNWTTLLVTMCEVRQAIDAKGLSSFVWMLEKLEVRRGLQDALLDVSDAIVDAGASGRKCYCLRLCEEVDKWVGAVGENISTDDNDW